MNKKPLSDGDLSNILAYLFYYIHIIGFFIHSALSIYFLFHFKEHWVDALMCSFVSIMIILSYRSVKNTRT